MVYMNTILVIISTALAFTHSHASSDTSDSLKQQLINDLDRVHKQVRTLIGSVRKLGNTINIADCRMGTNAELCREWQNLQNKDILNAINDQYNPGKRSGIDALKSKRTSEDFSKKRQILKEIEQLLFDMDRRLHEERKRSCRFNLGYDCKTSEYSAITDLHNYLLSDKSPGKRKRSLDQHRGIRVF